MFRLLNPRKKKPEKQYVDIHYEPARPRTADEVKGGSFTKPRSVTVSAAAAKTRKLEFAKPSPVSTYSPYPGWDVPHLTQTPWEAERHKKNYAGKRSTPQSYFPAHIFKRLPREVYDCILAQLEQIHLGSDQPCSSCYLKDLYNLCLTSRAWDKATMSIMYRKVVVLTNEEHAKLPKLRVKGTSRLKLLRRTLRERHALARCVRELHLSDFQALYEAASIEREEIVNTVASLVMACPYLERIVGFHVPFAHGFDRLSHALSTRPNLKERVWLLAEADNESLDEEDEGLGAFYHAACDPTERFLSLNSRHPLLSTLILHQEQEHDLRPLNFRAIVGTFRQFPILRNISISGLSAASFTNLALNALPPNLQTLRLENLPGINDKGLQRFATSQLATSIQRLTLVNLEITSFVTLSNILSSHLADLKRFTLIQDRAPGISSRESISDFHSPSLQYLHWEIRSQAGPLPTILPPSSRESSESPSFPFANPEPICCLATSLLATSIKDGAFPSLHQIRIPHDPQGVIQGLCKPTASALLASDASLLQTPPHISGMKELPILLEKNGPLSPKLQGFSTLITPPSPRADSAIESPVSLGNFSQGALTPMRSRLAAQSRILTARTEEFMSVRVYDPDGVLRLERPVGGFMGQLGSKITYNLKPDKGLGLRPADHLDYAKSEWVVGIEDLIGKREHEGAGHEQHWGSCGHLVGGRNGRDVVRAEAIF